MSSFVNRGIFPHLVLIFGMILWSSSFIGFKIALTEYTPLEVVAGRMFVASFFCLPYLKEVISVLKNKKTRYYLLGGTLAEPCFYFLFESFALQYTTASQAGMVIALMPLAVAVFARIFYKDKLSLLAWLGFYIALAGTLLISFTGDATISAPNPIFGNLLEFGAVLCGVAYTLCAHKLVNTMSPNAYTASMAFIGALFFAPLLLLPIEPNFVILDFSIPTWLPSAMIFYLGFVVSLVGYGCYTYGLTRLSSGRVASYINLIPIFTLMMGVLWLDEQLSLMQYFAAFLVLVGLVLSQVKKKEV